MPTEVSSINIPRATYRLQFNKLFTFADGEKLIPYLHKLGISHCYASPYLKARSGSLHGYDIVDHSQLNPEIGSLEDFESMVACLHRYDMKQILDIVPNHMGIGGDDNRWWLDVLEHGPASKYASYFDIDWQPFKEELRGKVLLPRLGKHYGEALEDGDIKLFLSSETGQFTICFYDQHLPVDPSTYPYILEHKSDSLLGGNSIETDPYFLEYQSLITAFKNLPDRNALLNDPERREERLRDSIIFKRRLGEICQKCPAIKEFIANIVSIFNGGQTKHFDLLHHLLENQAYRLTYWRVAAYEINYRRFFDVNDLAGLNMEIPEVFTATHSFILELIKTGKVDGLRIDHPDGLYDPPQYYQRLTQYIAEAKGQPSQVQVIDNSAKPNFYIVIEKILASYEHLPQSWSICGTTGYNFANICNGVFIYSSTQKELEQIYARFIKYQFDFDRLLYKCKKIIIKTRISSDLTVLVNMLDNIAQSSRYSRDFTLNGLREALIEILAYFPVYRTYINVDRVSEEDKRFIQWAIAQAKKVNPGEDTTIFDFIQSILLLEIPTGVDIYQEIIPFVMRFQQYTGPVMAKAFEDTALYTYNYFTSLNDVGCDPRNYGTTIAAFHRENQGRAQRWPYAMIASSTHDSKRSEDVRARINVLSEIPAKWRTSLNLWRRINILKIRKSKDHRVPSYNDEYLFYQTVLGTWPLYEMDEKELASYRDRIETYMIKAIREAKIYSSWISPDHEYESGLIDFIHSTLSNLEKNRFLDNFLPFQKEVASYGLLNSASQVFLKLTAPGVPDIYQGNELWEFRLVDPDSRAPVNFSLREQMLEDLIDTANKTQSLCTYAYDLLKNREDGRLKLFLIWKVLNFRSKYSQLFENGEYMPLSIQGEKADHLCAFLRKNENQVAIIIASRWFSILGSDDNGLPLGESCWQNTQVEIPEIEKCNIFRNILTDQEVEITSGLRKFYINSSQIFTHFPLALLIPSTMD
ncbi:malto-oligosyltrehalose synthase [Candidatus Nitrosacidococcus sp. I8]|uniref:malto-oligosyltrehalose synthase n=1 Tax=Candidatus Nitrosacidococcus sp. I8 TaxID=2942908 RepID=UPI0022263BED|nr:malto-oligosyltrehalose synthase [Candidatus Nitrosacidococcus sp. I8]CAH9018469.1 hypothetical protein NURINAE_00941 [Candidatus Nitrosacidococcus sp. I8]